MKLWGFMLGGGRGKAKGVGRHDFFQLMCCVLPCLLGNVMCRKIAGCK